MHMRACTHTHTCTERGLPEGKSIRGRKHTGLEFWNDLKSPFVLNLPRSEAVGNEGKTTTV